MLISLIAAVADNGVIGKDNTLIWKLPGDMKFFRETTMGHCVITGRKNYESIPLKFRPLPGRTNLVITRNTEFQAPGAFLFSSLEAALDFARLRDEKECFVIGGGEIYRLAFPLAHRLYITHVKGNPEGDTFFPPFLPEEWEVERDPEFEKSDKDEYDYYIRIYKRRNLKI
jgi:dihydrofolate reductase